MKKLQQCDAVRSGWHTGTGCFRMRDALHAGISLPDRGGESRKIVMVRGWIVQDRGMPALSCQEACRQLPEVYSFINFKGSLQSPVGVVYSFFPNQVLQCFLVGVNELSNNHGRVTSLEVPGS